MSDVLSNFQKRMRFISPIYLIAEKLSNRRSFMDYDMMNITFAMLCFLQEVTLAEDRGCDIDEIGEDFLFPLVNKHYNGEAKISRQEAVAMAKFIIEHVIENDGKMLRPKIADFENNRNLNPMIKLVEAETEVNRKNKYRLTHDGIEILFRTNEVDKEMRINIGMLILKESITSGNYDKAMSSIKELVSIAMQLRMEIEDVIKNIRLRVEEMTIDYVKSLQGRLNNQFTKQYEEFNGILNIISEKKEKINSEKLIIKDEEIDSALNKIEFIKEKLDVIIFEYGTILDIKQDIYNVYSEELDNAMSIGYGNSFDFKNIKKEVEKNTIDGQVMLSLFKPLLDFKFENQLNLKKFFAPQLIIEAKREVKPTADENDLDISGTVSDGKEKLIAELNDKYIFIVRTILEALEPNQEHWVSLSELLAQLKKKNKLKYNKLISRDFFTVLMKIFSNALSVLQIEEHCTKDNVNPNEEFQEAYVISEVCKQNNKLRGLQRLELKKENSKILEVGEFKITDIEMRVM